MQTSLPVSDTKTATKRPNQILKVFGWEMRRRLTQPSTWLLVVVAWLIFAGMTWLVRDGVSIYIPDGTNNNQFSKYATASLNQPWGFTQVLVVPLITVFGLILPFVATDGVSRDYKQRTHELLMTTPLGSRAYVGGRYLAVLVMSLGLTLVLLLGIISVGLYLHLTQGYAPLNLGPILVMWLLTVMPAMFVNVGLSFLLGTLWPRLTSLIKLGVVLTWFGVYMIAQVAFATSDRPFFAFAPWDISSFGLLPYLRDQYTNLYFATLNLPPGQIITDPAIARQAMRVAEQNLVNLSPAIGPHLILSVLGLILVGAALISFRRFANVLK